MTKQGGKGTARKKAKQGARLAQREPASLLPDHPVTLTIYLRHRQSVHRRPGSAVDLAELTRRVSRKELEAERRRILKGPVAKVRRFAQQYGMKVLAVDYMRRCMTLRTKAIDAERAFRTKLVRADEDGKKRYCPTCQLTLPQRLATIVHAVLGLDTRRPQFSGLRSHVDPNDDGGLLPSQIARLYGIATAGRGAGQCIGIIAPSGGYDPNDVKAACDAMRVSLPSIIEINVGNGRNSAPTTPPSRFDQELALDIQVVAGVAPEARIAIYFTDGQGGWAAGFPRPCMAREHART
jgi:kumamolisin